MLRFAMVLGILGAVSLVLGIITAAEAIPKFGPYLTWAFWLLVSAVLFASSISAGVIACKPSE